MSFLSTRCTRAAVQYHAAARPHPQPTWPFPQRRRNAALQFSYPGASSNRFYATEPATGPKETAAKPTAADKSQGQRDVHEKVTGIKTDADYGLPSPNHSSQLMGTLRWVALGAGVALGAVYIFSPTARSEGEDMVAGKRKEI